MRRIRESAVACLRWRWLQPVSTALGRYYGGVSTSLMYHRISSGVADPAQQRGAGFHPNLCLQVAEDRFDQQLRELRRRHRCVSLAQAAVELQDGSMAPGTVTVTFDDGYRDNLRNALPLLERHGVPATIFIATGLIDRTAVLWWEELERIVGGSDRLEFEWRGQRMRLHFHDDESRMEAFARLSTLFRHATPAEQHALMTRLRAASDIDWTYDALVLDWDEVRELDRHPLITIGAHTVSHPVLANIDAHAVASELQQSRERLEEELGHPVPLLAYPFGGPEEAGDREFELAREAGFSAAVTTRSGHWHEGHRGHPHALPRVMVEYFDTIEDFRFKLAGLDAFLRQRGRRFVTA